MSISITVLATGALADVMIDGPNIEVVRVRYRPGYDLRPVPKTPDEFASWLKEEQARRRNGEPEQPEQRPDMERYRRISGRTLERLGQVIAQRSLLDQGTKNARQQRYPTRTKLARSVARPEPRPTA
jgi:hypothetical protein